MSNNIAVNFEYQFFQYEKPNLDSKYSQENIRSNQLKILLEIATSSELKMHSQIKTSEIIFSCKIYGPQCFSIKFQKKSNEYKMIESYSHKTHMRKCQKNGQDKKFFQIYNLMKFKKTNIEEFMIQNNIINQSPSFILNAMSGYEEPYFFERHVNLSGQMRKKLRKRFDNIVNIDIKKIGKNYSVQRQKQKGNKKVKKRQIELHKSFKIASKNQKVLTTRFDNQQDLKKTNKKKIIKKSKIRIKKQKLKKKNKNIHKNLIVKNTHKNQENQENKQNYEQEQEQKQLEKNINEIEPQKLPEILQLQEEFDLNFSESSSEQIQIIEEEPEHHRQDYFESLRNSAIKQSLQKQSLVYKLLDSIEAVVGQLFKK